MTEAMIVLLRLLASRQIARTAAFLEPLAVAVSSEDAARALAGMGMLEIVPDDTMGMMWVLVTDAGIAYHRGTRWIVLEFHGKGDPFFGGSADDRPLGKHGAFLTGVHARSDYGTFDTKVAALAAGNSATNRRPKGLLLALPAEV